MEGRKGVSDKLLDVKLASHRSIHYHPSKGVQKLVFSGTEAQLQIISIPYFVSKSRIVVFVVPIRSNDKCSLVKDNIIAGLKLHLLFSTTVSSTQQEKAYEKVDSVTVTINRSRSTGKLHNRIQNYMHNLIKEIKDRI